MDNLSLAQLLREKVAQSAEIQDTEDLFEMCRIIEPENFVLAHEINKEVRKTSASIGRKQGLTRALALNKRSLLFDAPYDFDAYLLYIEFDRDPKKKFYQPRRKVLRVIAQDLQDLDDGKIDFLSISLPVRTGKTTIGCFFISWLMGKYPEYANVMSGHSDKLTSGFYLEVLSILTDPQYLWKDVFPDHVVGNTDAKNEAIDIDVRRRFSTLTCRSIGGTLTGAVEVRKCLYCDDLIEDLEESLNPIRLQNKYDAYANQLKDRMKEGAYQLMIGTRWSVADVQGRIEEQYRGNERYRFRAIPALNADGESNFDYPFGLGFSTSYYLDMKETIDDATFSAKYMCNPYIREGLLFPLDQLETYNGVLPDGDPDRKLFVCDVAYGGGDSLSLPVGYQYGDDIYVHDVVFNKGDKTVTQPLVVGKLKQHLPNMGRFEANNGGDQYSETIDNWLRKDGIRINIGSRKAPSNQSKLARIIQFSPEIKRFHFRDDKDRGKEYDAFMRELTSFVVNGKNPNDDAPDSLAMLADFAYHGTRPVEVFARPF